VGKFKSKQASKFFLFLPFLGGERRRGALVMEGGQAGKMVAGRFCGYLEVSYSSQRPETAEQTTENGSQSTLDLKDDLVLRDSLTNGLLTELSLSQICEEAEKNPEKIEWQTRFFVITDRDQSLKYYKDDKSMSQFFAAIKLPQVKIEMDERVLRVRLSATKTMVLRASTVADAQNWEHAIEQAKKTADALPKISASAARSVSLLAESGYEGFLEKSMGDKDSRVHKWRQMYFEVTGKYTPCRCAVHH
jgi:hypothetical protein